MAASGKEHFRNFLLCHVYAKGGMVNISFSSHVGASSILLRVSGQDPGVFKRHVQQARNYRHGRSVQVPISVSRLQDEDAAGGIVQHSLKE